jgi:hypothetical protein
MKNLLLNLTLFFIISTSLFAQYDKKETVFEMGISESYNILLIPFEKCKDSVVVEIEGVTAELDSIYYCYTNQDNFTDWGLHSFKVEGNKIKFTVREFRPFDALAIQFTIKKQGVIKNTYRRF